MDTVVEAGTEGEHGDGVTVQGGGGASAAGENEPSDGTNEQAAKQVPSSGTKSKQAKKIAEGSITNFVVSAPPKPQTEKHSKSVSSLLCKNPEVVAERHKSKMSQALSTPQRPRKQNE